MRRILVLIMWLWASMAPAQEADIQTVIAQQMSDIAGRDMGAAFDHASPMIQGMFGNPANFGAMVQQLYPMVWNNAETRFLELREIDGVLWQKLMIRDDTGGFHLLDYEMIETDRGWKIDGVVLLPAPDMGV